MNQTKPSGEPLAVAIVGAGGRVGQLLTATLSADERFIISGLLEQRGSSFIDEEIINCRSETIKFSENPGVAFDKAGVIIDFSLPAGTMSALEVALQLRIPFVSGTTGFSSEQRQRIEHVSEQLPILIASNMSPGITLVRGILRALMPHIPADFDIEIIERHHRRKRDSPSGTALDLITQIREQQDREPFYNWRCGRPQQTQVRPPDEITVHPVRGGGIIGEHQICFMGESEEIILTHRAFDRKVFIQGTLMAALFIVQSEPGFYTMDDVLGF
ncbi:4-hydroxy-tetrahydrodipicolinate reductase [candidate division CSSED10-310 bacterium]|uniref:4-hydroxy-tetrahydrodipicolinate reductase n=1 Tax=candidate division CSSED10-310 bacterium TaxID=2855610 RepID=A0ABV6Z2B0_UNCC1